MVDNQAGDVPRKRSKSRAPFSLGGEAVPAGTSKTIDLPISRLSTRTEITMPVRVLHGAKPGPTLFVSAAVHGNEIVGVEMIRRLLKVISIKRLAGTLLCIPVVNAYGFTSHSRYLPDGRDLNRVFPGTPKGSLASQLAHVFSEEIIKRSDYGIDLHSAGMNRENLPQIRYSPGNEKASDLADIFVRRRSLLPRSGPGPFGKGLTKTNVRCCSWNRAKRCDLTNMPLKKACKAL